MQLLQLSEATAAQRRIFFHAVDATDGIAAETGLTGVGRTSKNGAATAASSASISEIDSTNMPGRYYIELTAGELDTLGIIEFRYKDAACAEVVARAQVVSFDPYSATNLGLTNLDATISSRSDFDETADPVELLDTGGTAGSSASELVDDVWDEDIEAAHGGDAAAGLLLRVLGAAISNRANNATLDALLGISDVASQDLAEQLLRTETFAELTAAIPAATPTVEQFAMLMYMLIRNKSTTSASLLSVMNDAESVIAKQTLADASGTLTRSEMVAGP